MVRWSTHHQRGRHVCVSTPTFTMAGTRPEDGGRFDWDCQGWWGRRRALAACRILNHLNYPRLCLVPDSVLGASSGEIGPIFFGACRVNTWAVPRCPPLRYDIGQAVCGGILRFHSIGQGCVRAVRWTMTAQSLADEDIRWQANYEVSNGYSYARIASRGW
jgi:hypothetical protein